MATGQGFTPDWVSPPGETILDILQERNTSEAEFAHSIGLSLEDAKNLLVGRSTITIALARRLHRTLGASVEFWMARDFQYREGIVDQAASEPDWLATLPVSDMMRFGWLTSSANQNDEVNACLEFFNVPDVASWYHKYSHIQRLSSYRTSPSFDSQPAALCAWLRRGEIEADAIACKSWNARKFRESLSLIRALTRKKDPAFFIPRLQKYCAESGVAVVVVRAPSGCRASGATRFLSPHKAILQLSFRYLTDDQFWFTFFHEAGHLLLHNHSEVFVESSDTLGNSEEAEANEFAALTLIPLQFQQDFLKLRANAKQVIRFALHVGVSPGIVVGQLQHLGKIQRNHLNGLKRRYVWEES